MPPPTPQLEVRQPSPGVVHAWLDAPIFAEFIGEAARRHVHPDRLAAAIVDIVIRRGLIKAVLDRPHG